VTEQRCYQELVRLQTSGKSFHNVTAEIEALVRQSGVQTGLCNLFLRHSSASLVIQENADPDVLLDLETFFAQLIPEDESRYRHCNEGADDMPAHIRTVLTKSSEVIPVWRGRLGLGTWQGVYVWEHRSLGRSRELLVHITGN